MSQSTRDRIRSTLWKISQLKNLTYKKLQKYFPLPEMIEPISDTSNIPQFPIILLHGYYASPQVWGRFLHYFQQNGYILEENIFVFDGRGPEGSTANIDIKLNAKKLQKLIQNIKSNTGAKKVNLIAHSMGGLISRWYIEQLGGKGNVNKLIMLGTPNRGSDYLPIFGPIIEKMDNSLEKANQNIKNLHKKSVNKLSDYSEKELPTEKKSRMKPQFQKLAASTIKILNSQIKKITTEKDIDHMGTAAIQMTPGSDFLSKLGFKSQKNYFLIYGTQGLPQKYLPEGDNDGCVHVKSALLEGMPEENCCGFKLNHSQLHDKPIIFNKIIEMLK